MILLYASIAVIVFLAMAGALFATEFSHRRRADGSRYFSSGGNSDPTMFQHWSAHDSADADGVDGSFDGDSD